MFQYAVVEFQDRTMDIVGINWLIGDGSTTYWPRKGISTHQRRCSPPGRDWEVYSVNRILCRALNFSEARKQLIKLEDSSDYVPSDEGGRGSKRRCITQVESSDEEGPTKARGLITPKSVEMSTPWCGFPRPPSRLFEDEIAVLPSPASTCNITSPSTSSKIINLIPEESLHIQDCSWVSKQEFEAFKTEHFTMLNKILLAQQNVEEMLARSTGAHSREPLPEGAPQLPLKTEAEVLQLEQWLLSKANKGSLMNYLALIGGRNVEKSVRNIMGHILSKDLAPSFNWAGRGEKMAFSTLTIKNVVVSAALQYSSSTEEQANTVSRVEEAIKLWLKSAKNRLPKTLNKVF